MNHSLHDMDSDKGIGKLKSKGVAVLMRSPMASALLLAGLISASALAESPPSADPSSALLPLPQSIESKPGCFPLAAETKIHADGAFVATAGILAQSLRARTGLPLAISGSGTIRLLSCDRLPAEGYELEVTPEGTTILASTPAGAFYGGQTLLQLLRAGNTIPCVTITDAPRFPWRGLMLDCSRTFQSLDYLRRTIDRMAFYKMNVLHLHLTDDQGWRLEIKKYPELTAKGAQFTAKYNEPPEHQGYYTQEQMRDLVAYAAARNITVVPEIEMPGHSHEVLVCHPELSCAGTIENDIFPYNRGPGNVTRELCAGNEDTFRLLEDVLSEVMEIFPSKFIHIGGDEANKKKWQSCQKCQARIREQNLKDEDELQSYFIRRIEKFVNSKGRQIIGWDEILDGGLAPNAAVMSWRGVNGGIAAARAGHPVVMSPASHCYFDFPYNKIDTLRAYSYEPVPPEIDAEQAKLIQGLQANFWSHIDREPERVDSQLFPRLLGIAERGWSPQDRRDPKDFNRRVTAQLANLDWFGVNYHREPSLFWAPAQMTGSFGPLEWNVTAAIRGAGSYEVKFAYTTGRHRLAIRSVELLAGGRVLSADQHDGVTGAVNSRNAYMLTIPEFAPGTEYTLRAVVGSEGGTDSNGEIQIRPKR